MVVEITAAGVEKLMNQLSSLLADEIVLAWVLKTDRKKLQDTLPMIQSVIEDAESRQQEDESVRLWLKTLKDVAYDADDVLDEFAHEALRRDIEKKNEVLNFFSLSNPIAFRLKMAHKIKDVIEKLMELVKQITTIKLIQGALAPPLNKQSMYNRETFSMDRTNVIGREKEKSEIVHVLINSGNHESLSIIPIVGMGGLGKTALARYVYNDEQIKECFKYLRMWVYVSEDFNVKRLMGAITESANGKNEQSDGSSLEVVARKLQEELRGKKYLLVLDDVWNENNEDWDKLKDVLLCGIKGSKVIVTARKPGVASIMGALHKCQLESLPDDKSWSLFEQSAFRTNGGVEEARTDLVEIGKNIVKKCRGVPLVLKTIGAFLHDKREKKEWLSVESKLSFGLEYDQNGIMQVLMLSYNHLPPQMKRCFSFCSIFSKGKLIKMKTLIQLWMAEGLLEQTINRSDEVSEDVGHNYVKVFLNNSFFQDEERNELGDLTGFKMHDFFHDLARIVSQNECCDVEASKFESFNSINTRHLRVNDVDGDESVKGLCKDLKKVKNLRVILFDGVKLIEDVSPLMNLERLRVLDLSWTKIKKLSHSIVKLKHLRYLDLSHTDIEVLHSSITGLYHLQTLKLKGCYCLKQFPNNIKKLVNLRHLEIDSWTSIWQSNKMNDIVQLSFLQTLPVYEIGNESNCGMSELKCLKHLGGELQIRNLEKVKGKEDAESACLKEKQSIHQLSLHWNSTFGDRGRSCSIDDEVLDGLQPHSNLKGLVIDGFNGTHFPTWLSTHTLQLPNLVVMELIRCSKCEHLPVFGQFPNLGVLKIKHMYSLKRFGSCEFHGSATTLFPQLRMLELGYLTNLEEWVEVPMHLVASSSFPVLENLSISGCKKLKIMPTLQFPSLKTLVVEPSNGVVEQMFATGKAVTSLTSLKIFISELTDMPSGLLQNNERLQSVRITNCPNLKSFPKEEWRCLTNLKYLEIGGLSEEIDSYPFLEKQEDDGSIAAQELLPSLRHLVIVDSKLTALSKQIRYLTTLQRLNICGCRDLVALPECLGDLTLLQSLDLCSCDKLTYLPSAEAMKRLTSLQQLTIIGCPILKERCKMEGGEEWNKISWIPYKDFP